MLFNTWFGQMRAHPGVAGGYYFRPKRPIGRIQLSRLKENGNNTQYEADDKGNMDVRAPIHIRDFMALGYPIFDHFTGWTRPDYIVQFPMTDGLIWANNPEYDQKILEALNQFGRD